MREEKGREWVRMTTQQVGLGLTRLLDPRTYNEAQMGSTYFETEPETQQPC